MFSRTGIVAKTCIAAARRQTSRKMSDYGHGHGHPKLPTMNDMPIPSGSWQQAYNAKQTKLNIQLLASIAFFAATVTYSLPVSQESEGASLPSFKEGVYGVPDPMIHKFGSVRSDVLAKHPLEISEKKYFESQTNFDMAMMKRIQGIHAPLRLVMEREAAMKVQRLPFLASSNAMLDALTGRDETIGFENIFGDPENSDTMQNPHIIMEKDLGFM